MVDPDEVSVIDGDGVSTPDVLGVDIRDSDVLNDDVLRAADNTQTLALDNAGAALADQGFVRIDSDAENTGFVVADADLGGVGLVVVAPRVQVDGHLALGVSTPGSAAGSARGAFGAAEVEAEAAC